jgi:hypothetical protein
MARNKDPDWMNKAACKDTSNPFIFLSHDIDNITEAKSICEKCNVKKICKSVMYDVPCVAGGTTFLERMMERRKRIEALDDIKW